ncbi:MAG: Mur ligase domain-containing protein, partial [Limisphaerales bacterium]
MDPRTLKFIADSCGAQVLSGAPDTPVNNVCTDSRRTKPGDVFFALKGLNFDGHAFLNEAAEKKATAIVIERKKIPTKLPGCAVLVVEDTIVALGQFAGAYRRGFSIPVACVCGSN